MSSSYTVRILAILASLFATTAGAETIDFETLVNGQVVDDEYSSMGVTISATNVSAGPDLAVVFDSNLDNTEDPDLEFGSTGVGGAGWEMGNLAGTTYDLGNILIVQENSTGCADGVCDVPDDEGSRPAGSIFFDFDTAITSFGFDLIDVEGPEEYGTDSGYFASFFMGGVEVGRVGFADLINPASSFYDPTIVYGNNSANRISPITAAMLGIAAFDAVEINFGGSAAIDNIVFTHVPEPGTTALLVAGIGLMMTPRARRAAATLRA